MANSIILLQNTKAISLNNGKFTIVDDDDSYYWLNQFKWKLHSFGYAYSQIYIKGSSRKNQKMITTFMHRAIMYPDKNMQVDHINGDRLDNRKCNLRICTNQQNNCNKIKRNGASKYKGVYWHKQTEKWCAAIKMNYEVTHLGLFYNEEEAAKAYNVAALKYFGDYANLNKVSNE